MFLYWLESKFDEPLRVIKAGSTLRTKNLKTKVYLWKCIKCFPSLDFRGRALINVFGKLRFQNLFRPHENEKQAFWIPLIWKAFSKVSVLVKANVDSRPIEIKPRRFQISTAQYERCLNSSRGTRQFQSAFMEWNLLSHKLWLISIKWPTFWHSSSHL